MLGGAPVAAPAAQQCKEAPAASALALPAQHLHQQQLPRSTKSIALDHLGSEAALSVMRKEKRKSNESLTPLHVHYDKLSFWLLGSP